MTVALSHAGHQTGVSASFGGRRVARKPVDVIAGSLAASSAHTARLSREISGSVQRKEDDVAREGFRGGGGEIPYRADMERSFGADFSGVKSYAGADAAAASTQLGAHAYTVGNQVAFRTPSPDRALVAHELTHVLQQGGAQPQRKAASGASASAGEAQANAVESAVRAGQPALSALGGGVAGAEAGEPQRKFGISMGFSTEGFKKANEYEIWKPENSLDIPIAGPLHVKIAPAVKVFGQVSADWAGKNANTAAFELGVKGSIGLGLGLGSSKVAELYATLNPTITGAATLRIGQGWSLKAGIKVNVTGKIGVKLAGVVDKYFQFANWDMFSITGIHIDDKKGFDSTKLGFEWGKDLLAVFQAIETALNYGAEAVRAVADGAKNAYNAAAQTADDFIDFVTSW